MTFHWKAVFRDPLFHFAMIGALLYGGYLWWGPDPAHTIVVSDRAVEGMTAEIRKRTGRDPSAEEIDAAIDRYVGEEVLYREALALNLDQGDVIVRRRLIQKVEFLTEDLAAPHEPTEGELQMYWEQHPAEYRKPARYSFRHVFVDRSRHAAPEKAAALLGESLSGGVRKGDPFLRGDLFVQQTEVQIADIFGPGFARELTSVEPGSRWAGPLASAYGLHWVLLTERIPETQAVLADVLDRVRSDWRRDSQALENNAALRRLRADYQVHVKGREAP